MKLTDGACWASLCAWTSESMHFVQFDVPLLTMMAWIVAETLLYSAREASASRG